MEGVEGFRKLSREEVERYFRRRGQVDLSEYEKFLADIGPGEGGEVTLSGSLTQRAVKRRLNAAAKALNKQLVYSRHSESGKLRFRVR